MFFINWEAISAIGQLVSALFTALALYFALRRDKPRILVKIEYGFNSERIVLDKDVLSSEHNEINVNNLEQFIKRRIKDKSLRMIIVNRGHSPIYITDVGIKFYSFGKRQFVSVSIEKMLMPTDQIKLIREILFLVPLLSADKKDYKIKSNRWFVYASDNIGNEHFFDESIKGNLVRYFSIIFFKVVGLLNRLGIWRSLYLKKRYREKFKYFIPSEQSDFFRKYMR